MEKKKKKDCVHDHCKKNQNPSFPLQITQHKPN